MQKLDMWKLKQYGSIMIWISVECTWKRSLFPVSFDSVDSTTSTRLPLMSPCSQGILRAAAPRCGRPAGPGGDLRALPWLVDGLRDSSHRGGCLAVKSTPPGRGWLCFLALGDFVFSGLACIFWRKEGQSTPNIWVIFL